MAAFYKAAMLRLIRLSIDLLGGAAMQSEC